MATYYVGSGGDDGNNGTTWALRKLTLNGAEDIAVAADDTVYVGPGVYRELLTCDVSGAGGQPITYIADVTGEHTDGVGGPVRITGSDDDQAASRAHCIYGTGIDYRTFRGFTFDMATTALIQADDASNWISEDCTFQAGDVNTHGVYITGDSDNCTIRRCRMLDLSSDATCIYFNDSSTKSDTGHVVENCALRGRMAGIWSDRIGGFTVRNCLMSGLFDGVRVGTALAAEQTIDVNNCIVLGCYYGFRATANGEITEDYNALWANHTDRSNTDTGAHSNAYPALWAQPLLLDDYVFPFEEDALSEWSSLAAITGTSTASDDLYGRARPATAAKLSWGPVQYNDVEQDTGTVHGGSLSLKLADAGRAQMKVPVTNVSTTISVYAYHEANYAGTLPQLIIKQPGQSDDTTTDTGGSGSWNQLSTTLTPASDPAWVIVELVSNNTAVAGNYATYFDDLAVV